MGIMSRIFAFFVQIVIGIQSVVACFSMAIMTKSKTVIDIKRQFWKKTHLFDMVAFEILLATALLAGMIISSKDGFSPGYVFAPFHPYLLLACLYFSERFPFCCADFIARGLGALYANSTFCKAFPASVCGITSSCNFLSAYSASLSASTPKIMFFPAWPATVKRSLVLFFVPRNAPRLFRIFAHGGDVPGKMSRRFNSGKPYLFGECGLPATTIAHSIPVMNSIVSFGILCSAHLALNKCLASFSFHEYHYTTQCNRCVVSGGTWE
jgi:hypothetical protein